MHFRLMFVNLNYFSAPIGKRDFKKNGNDF
jgi:hypothetical protein